MPRSIGVKLEINTLEQLAAEILNDACPSSVNVDKTDFNLYYVSTHCVQFWIVAKKHDDKWIIKSVTASDC